MKVLHIISSGGMYGAESVILNLLHAMHDSGNSGLLGVFENLPNPNLQLHERAQREGLESRLIPCNGQLDLETISRIRSFVQQCGANVVHAHGYKADIYTYFALRGTRIPFVSTCHNWLKQNRIVAFHGIADRFVLRQYPRVIAVSEEVKQRLLTAGVRPERVRLVMNGIDLRPYDSLVGSERQPGSVTVGLVGRLSYEKGVDLFLRAATKLVGKFPEAHFVVVGEGPDREKLETMIDGLQIRRNVTMLGRRDDMPAVYAMLDIMVSSSRQEGLPMAILEGMASRCALVATAVGEVPSVVRDGETGVVVPPENVDALATAVGGLLGDSERRARLGAAGHRLVKDEYSAGRMTADYLRIYDEAIAVMRDGAR